jgi:hypothetical protein
LLKNQIQNSLKVIFLGNEKMHLLLFKRSKNCLTCSRRGAGEQYEENGYNRLPADEQGQLLPQGIPLLPALIQLVAREFHDKIIEQ